MILDNKPATLFPYRNQYGVDCEGILVCYRGTPCPVHGQHIHSALVFGPVMPGRYQPWAYLNVPFECIPAEVWKDVTRYVDPALHDGDQASGDAA